MGVGAQLGGALWSTTSLRERHLSNRFNLQYKHQKLVWIKIPRLLFRVTVFPIIDISVDWCESGGAESHGRGGEGGGEGGGGGGGGLSLMGEEEISFVTVGSEWASNQCVPWIWIRGPIINEFHQKMRHESLWCDALIKNSFHENHSPHETWCSSWSFVNNDLL